MGALSPIARFISGALRDSSMRHAVAAAMKESSTGHLGLDLQTCGTATLVQRLMLTGEQHGMGSAQSMCAVMSRFDGLTLFMDPDRLSRWNGRAIPIVTAIADLHHPLPNKFLGYRSPARTIELSASDPVNGPLLVVLPMPNRTSAMMRTPTKASRMIRLPIDSTPRRVLP